MGFGPFHNGQTEREVKMERINLLQGLPERAKVLLGVAIGMAIVKAGNDMLLSYFEAYPQLNDTVPKEWPFNMSLDEQSAELHECQMYYRDQALSEVANVLLDGINHPRG
jgi:hypothetical protein